MKRKLFCEISPATYAISVFKCRLIRRLKNLTEGSAFSKRKGDPLPHLVYAHKSLIRRKLGNVDMQLQENKAINLAIAVPRVSGILIHPGEIFSFWALVGNCTHRKGYKEGLTISSGKATRGVGGGMCQFSNLIHWLALHSPLTVAEHHHHDGIDLFPDYGRQVPFGCGTSILYNYLDYRLKNDTRNTFQLIVYTTDTHLCGELRSAHPLAYKYHVVEEDRHFVRKDGVYYRRNTIRRRVVDKRTGSEVGAEEIKKSDARVLYSDAHIDRSLLRP